MHYLSGLFAASHVVFLGQAQPGQPNWALWTNLQTQGQPRVVAPTSRHWPPAQLAVITTPVDTWAAWFKACAKHHIRHILVVRHFSEALPNASEAEQLRSLAKSLGLRILGPNVIGLLRPVIGLNASYHQGRMQAGSLALVSQSSALSTAMLDWAHSQSLGFSSVIVLGDTLDVDMAEVFDFLSVDSHTKTVLLHIDHLQEGRRWLTALRRLSRTKPVIVLKSGHHPKNSLFDAVLARLGVLRVDHLAQLFTSARILAANHRVHGRALAIVSNGLGTLWLGEHAALQAGLPLAKLTRSTQHALGHLLPSSTSRHNPIDLLGHASPACFADVVGWCVADPNVDAVLVIFTPQWGTDALATARALCELQKKHPRIPLFLVWMGGTQVATSIEFLATQQMAYFHAPEFAIDVFKQLMLFRQHQTMLVQLPNHPARNQHFKTDHVIELFQHALAQQRHHIQGAEAQEIIGLYMPYLLTDDALGRPDVQLSITLHHDTHFGRYLELWPLGPSAQCIGPLTFLPPLNESLIEPYLHQGPWHNWLHAHLGAATDHALGLVQEILLDLALAVCDVPELYTGRLDVGFGPWQAWRIEHVAWTLKATDESLRLRHEHLAIMPYPKALEQMVVLKDATDVLIRPIRAEDAPSHQRFVEDLSEESRYNRYLAVIKKLPDQLLVRFTQIDYDSEMALVMCLGDQWLGIARYTRSFDAPNQGEFSLEIADAWQGKGVGTLLMDALLAAAYGQGITQMVGDVLAINRTMHHLMHKIGFSIQPHPDDSSLVRVVKDLVECRDQA